MRVILDTSVLIAAMRSPVGSSAEILRFVLARKITILMDYKLFCEYEAVALRSHHLHAIGAARAEASSFLQVIADLAEPVMVSYLYRPLSQDSNDDMVLELAINARADAVISFNARHFVEPLRSFGIDVYRPAEFLKKWRK